VDSGFAVRIGALPHTWTRADSCSWALVAWIVAGLEGAVVVGSVSALGPSGKSRHPKDSVLKYDVAVKTDKYVLVVHGTPEEVEKAKDIIAELNRAITRFMARQPRLKGG